MSAHSNDFHPAARALLTGDIDAILSHEARLRAAMERETSRRRQRRYRRELRGVYATLDQLAEEAARLEIAAIDDEVVF